MQFKTVFTYKEVYLYFGILESVGTQISWVALAQTFIHPRPNINTIFHLYLYNRIHRTLSLEPSINPVKL